MAIASVGTTEGAPELAGLLLGIGLMGWGLEIWRMVQAFRTREQCFDIHERRFTHRVAGAATVIPWGDVAQVSTSGGDGRPLADARGMGSTCEIRLHSGRRIRVDAFTEDILSEPTTRMFFAPGLRLAGRPSPILLSTAAVWMLPSRRWYIHAPTPATLRITAARRPPVQVSIRPRRVSRVFLRR
jgi:hypothetical protein